MCKISLTFIVRESADAFVEGQLMLCFALETLAKDHSFKN